jgi:hypothetical protein
MANRSFRRLATLRSVTAPQEVIRMMSSRRAAPHQGSGCVTSPTHEAEYMAATVLPIRRSSHSPCLQAGSIYDGRGTPPFSVILNGGCRSEESLTTSVRSVTQSSPVYGEGQGEGSGHLSASITFGGLLSIFLSVIPRVPEIFTPLPLAKGPGVRSPAFAKKPKHTWT